MDAFSILYLDIDRFRTINNSFDHVTADQLLILFSQRLRKNINTPSLLARIGGNEFAILLWDYSQKDYPVKMSESIMNSLRDPFFVGNHEFNLTVGIGISTYPANGTTLKELLKNTEAALFQAKRKGKNHYHISSSPMTITSYKQYYLERDLHYSIKNNQLRVHLQPRVDTLTGKIVSAEALVRWEHPVWGLVSPNEFIPLAEEIGFINDIGDWVLNEVCTYLSEWQKNKLSVVPISINISSDRFFKSDWKSTFYKIMDETHVDPSLIELEITETTLIKHKNEVQTAIQFLKGLGVKIALDDFGTGYSSLSHINDFSIDTIKIDQTFIKQITQTANVEIIIQSLIHLAKGLKMRVVAEGVETIEQLTFLKQLECHEIQGYIFSKPVPENDFRSLLHKSILNPMNKNHPTNNRERRSFFRMNLQNPLSTYMTLVSINDKKVEIGKTEVLMEDIGPGGIRFLSNIQLPVKERYHVTIRNENIGPKG